MTTNRSEYRRWIDLNSFSSSCEVSADMAEMAINASADFGTDDIATDIADQLANLMHLCDRAGISFTEQLTRAEGYHADASSENGLVKRDERRFPA